MPGTNPKPIRRPFKQRVRLARDHVLGVLFQSGVRAVPTFLGLGAAKSGTTSLSLMLNDHPQISMPRSVKELHFFDEHYPKGKHWYFSMFSPNDAVGEITPSYLFMPECRDRIAEVLGSNVKFLVCLRDPVKRAYSHYCHARNNWHTPRHRAAGYPQETLSFEEAIEAEPERLKSGLYSIRHQSYFTKGLYADQLRHFFERFPRKQFFVFLFETFVTSPQSVLYEIYQFLGVDPAFSRGQRLPKTNVQSDASLSKEMRERLYKKYENAINDLETLLEWDLDVWRH